MAIPRWYKCIDHYGSDVKIFFDQHFNETHRKCLYIAGAGVDPRSTIIINDLSSILKNRLECIFIKEERPNPHKVLIEKADNNLQILKNLCTSSQIKQINVFSDDNAVIGGIHAVNFISSIENIDKYTDIVIDFSALSIGISFPIAKFIYEKFHNQTNTNIHLVVVSNPDLDLLIESTPNDRATYIRGFSGTGRLYSVAEKAKLWLPQFAKGKKETLKLIFNEVKPHDTCPILPFPAKDPKKGDKLVVEFISELNFLSELESEWNIDTRNFVYADEENPLDIYRTILRIDDERKPVFENFGGSVIIISPLGSKILSIGVLMAAMERQFPLVYVESLEYNVKWDDLPAIDNGSSVPAHIWLHGEAYLQNI